MSEERYEIIKLLGKGRTGGVYEAEDTRLGRKVAMRRFFSQTELTDVSNYKEDFINISQSLSALQHPNLLRVYDAGVDEDGAFMITHLLSGDTLHNRLKEGPLPSWDVWDMGHQMLDALSTAHDGGCIHGAITPGSILMSPRARGGYLYVILDMGLCKLAPLIQGKDSILSIMADPAILAPELFDESQADEKSDLYMIGNIIYMCLAGGHPFANKSLAECGELHKQGLPPITDYATDAPADFVAWLETLYRVNPADRPASVVEALKTMPKVSKPAKTNLVASAAAAGSSPTLTAGPLTHVSPATVPLSTTGPLSTGPLTAGPGSTLGSTLGRQTTSGLTGAPSAATYQQPKKSYKALFITIAAIVLLALVLVFTVGGGKKKKTGEQIAAERAKKAAKKSQTEETKVTPATPR